jgi:acetyl esterase/lipase
MSPNRLLIALSLFGLNMASQAQTQMPLYVDSIPNSKPVADEEKSTYERDSILIISKITRPAITVYLPAAQKANGAAVIICPGGGYWVEAAGHEGAEVAKRFNESGITAFVLKYRIPDEHSMLFREIGPLQDAQRAVQLVRENADRWGIDKHRIGIMGFSAGGHLASTEGTHFNKPYIPNTQHTSLRPDFMILIYPVISFTDSIGHKGSAEQIIGKNPTTEKILEYSNEFQVTPQTPPSFLVHARDDQTVDVRNTLLFASALKKNNVPVELYLYDRGGHGFGMNNKTSNVRWMDLCIQWMKTSGWLNASGGSAAAQKLYEYDADAQSRWSSPENSNGGKGQGGKTNNGAKGHPSDPINPGETKSLLDVKGTGLITRIWLTINDRSAEMLRSLKLDMFWDDEQKPAVSVPLGDFFGVGLGRTAKFHNTFFANPEGRSFLCFIPMPFKKSARITITNESNKILGNLFYDVDFQFLKNWNEDNMYFHAFWNRDTSTTLAKDYEFLPAVNGKGRFLGVNFGVNANPVYQHAWWGEGEVKIYLDGDQDYPTLVGTGTEDYIGSGWGQGFFFNDFSGCLIADEKSRQWAFYRFHIPDPIFFESGCRATIQQIGGDGKEKITALQEAKQPLIPVTISSDKMTYPLYQPGKAASLKSPNLPKQGWTNFYRSDDISSTAYFFLDKPVSNLPSLPSIKVRIWNTGSQESSP